MTVHFISHIFFIRITETVLVTFVGTVFVTFVDTLSVAFIIARNY